MALTPGPWKGGREEMHQVEGEAPGRRLCGKSADSRGGVTDQPWLVLGHFITHLSRPRMGFSFLFLLKPCDDNYRESFERRKPSHESFNLVVFSYDLMDTYLTAFADSRSAASYLFLT